MPSRPDLRDIATNVRDAFADSDRETNALEDGNIREIVTHEGDFRVFQAGFREYFFVGRHFEGNFHVDVIHFHFAGAAKEGRAFAARDAAGLDAGRVGEREALAVMGVEFFYFQRGAVGLGEKKDSTVGHGAVDIHQEEFDLRGTFFQSGRDFGSWGQDGLQGMMSGQV